MKTTPLTKIELEQLAERLPGWSRVAVDGVLRIERTYAVPDFAIATSFTQLLGEMADEANHHPTVLVQRAHVTVAWWTMSAKTLTHIDLTMAERTDRLFDAIQIGKLGDAVGKDQWHGVAVNRQRCLFESQPLQTLAYRISTGAKEQD